MTGIGAGLRRLDGPAKVTGQARYAADFVAEGHLHAVLVGAALPSGTVTAVVTSHATAVPGVERVLVAGDFPRPADAFAEQPVPPLATRHLPLQDDRVVYHGQPVAMVLADTLEAAEDAASRVLVQIEAAPWINPESAAAQTPEPAAYAALGALDMGVGDIDAALGHAPITVAGSYTQPSRHHNPMEPSAILAHWSGDQLTVHDSVQHLYAVQSTLAAVFGLDPSAVRVVCPHTGGGFGAKAFIWPHEILAAMAARILARPVKLVLTRAQMYSIVGYQPWMSHDVTLAAERSGALAGIRHDVINITATTDDYVEFGTATAAALYASPAIATSQRVRRGHVNLPTFMRSPIDGPGTWALGSALDELARATGTDPVELRLRNYADREPASGKPWSSKKLAEAYAAGVRRFGWRERPRGGTRDGHWRIGCGVADATQGQVRFPSQARLTLDASGHLTIEAGLTDLGQGPPTIFPQIAADILGLAPEEIELCSGDSTLPFAGPTYGSATTIGMGAAVLDGAQQLLARLAELAGWPAGEVTARDGRLCRDGDAIPLTTLMASADGRLTADGAFNLPGGAGVDAGPADMATRTFGVVFVEVGVDAALGLVRLRRATGVYSAGRIINERTARSQMIGGIVWGWGMASSEASVLEPQLGRWQHQNLAGIALPVNADIPAAIDIAFIDETDTAAGPLGAKGIGELSATGVAAAVANAVFDAVGIRFRELPITPARFMDAVVRDESSSFALSGPASQMASTAAWRSSNSSVRW
jgi:xanthine dehydrogenase YagR molybdenum-binding subunit